ncbi:MAG: hypothetical protein ABSG45_08895 [Nitrososphaerales archaeon]
MTLVGLNVNLALSVWFDSHSWSCGTTRVGYVSHVMTRRWNVLPTIIWLKETPPPPSPVPLIHTAMLLLWQ